MVFQFTLPLSCSASVSDCAKPGLLYSFFFWLLFSFPLVCLGCCFQAGPEALFYLVSPGPAICNDSIVCSLKGQSLCLTSMSLADRRETKSNNTLPAIYSLKYSSSSIKKKPLWWHIHLVLTLGRPRQKEQELTWIIRDYVLLALLVHLNRFYSLIT